MMWLTFLRLVFCNALFLQALLNITMILYDRFVLDNGLRVLVHEDHSTPMAVVNIMYDVGSRDENPEKTGFAHLFEHLMFGGSIHIPDYDEPLQRAGGENNAYTTTLPLTHKTPLGPGIFLRVAVSLPR